MNDDNDSFWWGIGMGILILLGFYSLFLILWAIL